MTLDTMRLRGVRQNNLRGLDLDLTKRSLIVVVGVSGSGKSSLVFDTIAAEAQRQLNATFSAFAQSYLPSYGRPDTESIENLSACVVIGQRRLQGGPRSTLATVTDIGDWLRVLWSRASTPHVGHAGAFSFNDPAGMCPQCQGLGVEKVLDLAEFVDESRSLREGPFRHPDFAPGMATWRKYADSGLFDVDVPIEQFSERELHLLLEAEAGQVEPTGVRARPGDYEGAAVLFRRTHLTKDSATLRGRAKEAYAGLVTSGPCTACEGSRLNEAARTATVAGLTLPRALAIQVSDLIEVMRAWDLGPLDALVADITTRLDRLVDLGLGYLHLARETATLSGGEAQRVTMVRHLGSTLNDLLYIFDEPTTGLHARDVDQLGRMLQRLRDQGNTVLVVEHDPAIMRIADQLVEIGLGAGIHGGELLFQGTFEELREADTPTGQALRTARGQEREPLDAGVVDRDARRDPATVRQADRAAGLVVLPELRRRVPRVRGHRPHHHRARLHRRGDHPLRDVPGAAVPRRRAEVSGGRPVDRRRLRDDRRGGAGVLHRPGTAGPARAGRPGRSGLPDARPVPDDAVRW
ncbi:hypothetical protein MWU75_10140 [Ornithinimicrobium sp. F0845]|uniref:hypothetical protein n=1 Tax=Ornithinimicrobium sp. F0845 TaxID=2926412 RepID=UPI001FF20FC3|nr:hypothetical protein [Ornithinimicrobium sp. F0845]MCK0112497.1 hypothetical protein [Ornithinimicrobium sp. F0845]